MALENALAGRTDRALSWLRGGGDASGAGGARGGDARGWQLKGSGRSEIVHVGTGDRGNGSMQDGGNGLSGDSGLGGVNGLGLDIDDAPIDDIEDDVLLQATLAELNEQQKQLERIRAEVIACTSRMKQGALGCPRAWGVAISVGGPCSHVLHSQRLPHARGIRRKPRSSGCSVAPRWYRRRCRSAHHALRRGAFPCARPRVGMAHGQRLRRVKPLWGPPQVHLPTLVPTHDHDGEYGGAARWLWVLGAQGVTRPFVPSHQHAASTPRPDVPSVFRYDPEFDPNSRWYNPAVAKRSGGGPFDAYAPPSSGRRTPRSGSRPHSSRASSRAKARHLEARAYARDAEVAAAQTLLGNASTANGLAKGALGMGSLYYVLGSQASARRVHALNQQLTQQQQQP